MAKTIEKAIFGVLMVLVLGIGSVFVTAVATNTNPMNWVSSIRVADSGDDNAPEVSEAEESVQLATLNGLITPEEAQAYAIKAVEGKNVGQLTDVALENENGNVVYAVEFSNNGVETDVKIDAGNGKVLLVEDDNNEADVEDEKESDFDDDNIEHEFEGDEGDHED